MNLSTITQATVLLAGALFLIMCDWPYKLFCLNFLFLCENDVVGPVVRVSVSSCDIKKKKNVGV